MMNVRMMPVRITNSFNAKGEHALNIATKHNSVRCIEVLLNNARFDINTPDQHGNTAIMWAVKTVARNRAPISLIVDLAEKGASYAQKTTILNQ